MKIIEVSALALRVLGILLFLRLLGNLLGWMAATESLPAAAQEALSKPLLIALYAIPLGISLILMKFPITLAGAITPVAPDPEQGKSGESSFFVAGICLLGIYFVARSVPDVLYNLISIIIYANSDAQSELKGFYLSEFITVVELAIGLYLMLGSKGVAYLIERLRNAGLPYNRDERG